MGVGTLVVLGVFTVEYHVKYHKFKATTRATISVA